MWGSDFNIIQLTLCIRWMNLNSFMREVLIIKKSVHGFALQINGVVHIVRLTMRHHLFLEFWLVDTCFFADWRRRGAVTRLENVHQSNIRRSKKLGFQFSHKHPRFIYDENLRLERVTRIKRRIKLRYCHQTCLIFRSWW